MTEHFDWDTMPEVAWRLLAGALDDGWWRVGVDVDDEYMTPRYVEGLCRVCEARVWVPDARAYGVPADLVAEQRPICKRCLRARIEAAGDPVGALLLGVVREEMRLRRSRDN